MGNSNSLMKLIVHVEDSDSMKNHTQFFLTIRVGLGSPINLLISLWGVIPADKVVVSVFPKP